MTWELTWADRAISSCFPAAVNDTSACGSLHRAILVAEYARAGCDARWRGHVSRITGIGDDVLVLFHARTQSLMV